MQMASSSENEPQPELQDSGRVCIRSRCNRSKVRRIAYITVGSAKNYGVKEVKRLGTELKLPIFTPDRKSAKYREVHVPITLCLESIWANIAKGAQSRCSKRCGIEPTTLGMNRSPICTRAGIGISD